MRRLLRLRRRQRPSPETAPVASTSISASDDEAPSTPSDLSPAAESFSAAADPAATIDAPTFEPTEPTEPPDAADEDDVASESREPVTSGPTGQPDDIDEAATAEPVGTGVTGLLALFTADEEGEADGSEPGSDPAPEAGRRPNVFVRAGRRLAGWRAPSQAVALAAGRDDRPPARSRLRRRALRAALAALALAVPGSMVAGATMMGGPATQSMTPDLGGSLPTQEDDALDPFLDPDLLAAVPVGPEEVSEDVEEVLGSSEVVDTLDESGIPEVALDAYVEAADRTEIDDPGCGIRWTLLAAIGRVESNHGRFGGAQLRDDGYGTRPIRGIPLDGRANVALIRDTEDGDLDGDTTYDRAVGPMQFIPSTWRSVNVDADGDGRADPNNIFDAALGAAVYLCRGGGDLGDVNQRAQAVRRYNNADEYVRVVLNLAETYEAGDVEEIPSIGLPPMEPTPPPRPSPGPPRPRPPATARPPGPAPVPAPTPTTAPRPPATTAPRPPATIPATTPATTPTTTRPTTSTTLAPSSTTTSTTVPAPSTSTTVPGPTTTTVPEVPTTAPAPPDTAAVGWAPAMREVVVQILEAGGPAPQACPAPDPAAPTPTPAPPGAGPSAPCSPPATEPPSPPASPAETPPSG